MQCFVSAAIAAAFPQCNCSGSSTADMLLILDKSSAKIQTTEVLCLSYNFCPTHICLLHIHIYDPLWLHHLSPNTDSIIESLKIFTSNIVITLSMPIQFYWVYLCKMGIFYRNFVFKSQIILFSCSAFSSF